MENFSKTPQVVGVNVAPESENGHYVKNAKKVIMIDEKEGMYMVNLEKGETATLETVNHGTVHLKEDAVVFHQDAVNPFTNVISKVRD